MTLRFHARIDVAGGQASQQVDAVNKRLRTMRGSTEDVTRAGTRATGSLDRMADAARTAGEALDEASSGADDFSSGFDDLGDSAELSGGSIANLTAQLNDIGTQLAAGQSPLQLAIQQGTQIAQIFGDRGARQAVVALGQAFRQMVSPVNLVTIGVIAAGAALTQYLTRGTKDADDLTDALQGAVDTVEELRAQREALVAGFDSPEELALAREIRDIEREIADEVERRGDARGRELRLSRQRTAALAAEAAEQRGMLVDLQTGEELNNAILAAREAGFSRVMEIGREQTQLYLQRQQALSEILGSLSQENALLQVQAEFGQNSAEFARAREAAERDALESVLDAIPGHQAIKEEIRAAFEAQLRLNAAIDNADLSGLSGQAALLARRFGIAASEAERLNAALNQSAGLPDVTPSGGGLSFPGIEGSGAPLPGTGFANLGFGNLDGRPPGGSRTVQLRRETDTVEQELIRNARRLEGATTAQVEGVRAKLAELQREEALQARISDLSQEAGRATMDVLRGITRGGEEAQAALARVVDRLVDMGLQALVLGTGPLGGLFGGGLFGGGGGGLLSGLFGGFRADGGPVSGSRAYVVGERGPELFVPRAAGMIVPNGAALAGAASAPQMTVVLEDATGGGLNVRRRPDRMGADGSRSPVFELADAVGDAMAVRGGGAHRFLARRGVRDTGPLR